MVKKITTLLAVLILAAITSTTLSQDSTGRTSPPDRSKYQLEEVASGLDKPVFLTHAGDGSGRIFIVSQNGQIWIMQNGAVSDTPFLDVSSLISRDSSERGLLGLAFHPDYANNGQFFIDYTDTMGNTMVARYRVSSDNPDVADPNSAQTVLQVNQPYANHNGGEVVFGPDGYLYIGLGDGGSAGDPRGNAQNGHVLLGKLLRIDINSQADDKPYAIPPDNPYVNNAAFEPEIWAYGLRNPWRFSFDRMTGDLYIGDVGQDQYEEIDFQPANSPGGENYGWRIMEGNHSYSRDANPGTLVRPIAEYTHSDGCSITGGYVYRGQLMPDLQGVYLFSDYCFGTVWDSYQDSAGDWRTNIFLDTPYTVSSFGEDEAGELYLLDHTGSILQLVPTE